METETYLGQQTATDPNPLTVTGRITVTFTLDKDEFDLLKAEALKARRTPNAEAEWMVLDVLQLAHEFNLNMVKNEKRQIQRTKPKRASGNGAGGV